MPDIAWDYCEEEVKPIVSELIESFSEKLNHIKPSRIGYLTFSKKTSKKLAFVQPIKKMYSMYMDLDYLMCIHLESWMGLTISEKKVLVLHELAHIPEGGFDDDSKEYRKTIDHDIQDFSFILKTFGIHWEDSAKILKEGEVDEPNENEENDENESNESDNES